MDETMNKSKTLLDKMQANYKSETQTYSKMVQYFLQATELGDFLSELSQLSQEPDDDDDSSSASPEDLSQRTNEYTNDELDDDESVDDTVEDEETLGSKVKARWEHRKKKLISDLCIAGWMVNPSADVMEDCYKNNEGWHQNATERILKKRILKSIRNVVCFLVSIVRS
jgi:hypothetical protein